MCVKKQIRRSCKIFSVYEEKPEEFSDETDVDIYFYRNIFDISQSQHPIVWVSRGSNKKLFAIKLFQVCDLKTQQRYILQEEMLISKRELTSLVNSLLDFPQKLFITLASVYRFPYRSPKLRLDLQSQKTISLLNTITISLNIQIDKFVYRSVFETTILAYFRSKCLNYTAINLFLLIVNLNRREIHHLYKNRFYAAIKCEINESNYDV